MDHRHGKRIDIQLDVLLYNQGLPVASGKTRNVAPRGVFVETDYRPESGNLYVEVVFIASDENGPELYRVKGLIAHSMRDGVGLIIDDFDPERKLPIQMPNTGRSGPDRGRLL